MTTPQIICLSASEIVALVVIVRLWLKRRRQNPIVRVLWTVLLLVPLMGVLLYFFLNENPDDHPYDTDTSRQQYGSEEDLGGGHHH